MTPESLLNFVREYPLAAAAAATAVGLKGNELSQGKGTLSIQAAGLKGRYDVESKEFYFGFKIGFKF